MLDQFRGSEETIAEAITGGQTVDIIVVVITVASAIAFVMLVRQLTDRHTHLTGEATL